MSKNKSLFDDGHSLPPSHNKEAHKGNSIKKDFTALERLKNLEDKIASAIEKVKALKEEKTALEQRIKELEEKLGAKDKEMERLHTEKTAIKSQVEGLISELDTLEVI